MHDITLDLNKCGVTPAKLEFNLGESNSVTGDGDDAPTKCVQSI